jgi:hypothetical protein
MPQTRKWRLLLFLTVAVWVFAPESIETQLARILAAESSLGPATPPGVQSQAPDKTAQEKRPPGAGKEPVADKKQWEALKSYCGKQLDNLQFKDLEKLLAAVQAVLPKQKHWPFIEPYALWKIEGKRQSVVYALLESQGSYLMPGSTDVRITLFDPSGEVLSETAFQTGYRCYFESAKQKTIKESDFPLIVLEIAHHGGPDPDIARQYYAKIGASFQLIRLEDSRGKAARNRYDNKAYAGPALPRQTARAWEADVTSSDRFKCLRALVWLGGNRWEMQSGERRKKDLDKPEDIRLVRQVRASEKVIARVRELAAGKDPWLAEAAQLALAPRDFP